ncbi:MAG: hypothetical protein ACRETZ_18065 [Steroidobacteraceae bacterium]
MSFLVWLILGVVIGYLGSLIMRSDVLGAVVLVDLVNLLRRGRIR